MEKPLLEHLIELRKRLISCLVVFGVVFIVAYGFAEPLFQFLVEPLARLLKDEPSRRLIYTGLTEAFLTYLKVSFFAALFVTFPFILYHIWRFVAPGLYGHEKRVLSPYLVATPLLFLAGAAMAYYVVCPMAWEFFLSFETPASSHMMPIQLEARVSEYLSLMIQLIFAFGICFQLPIVVLILARLGLVSAVTLQTKRKYAFLFITIGAAIFTPPDIISPLSLIIPLYTLYEISIILVKLGEKKRTLSTKEQPGV